jgi:tetratricopeptide (TPR) repeat protein
VFRRSCELGTSAELVCAASVRGYGVIDPVSFTRTRISETATVKRRGEGPGARFPQTRRAQAIEDFKRAKELNPSLLNASLYLATTYANQYVPGASSKENTQFGQQAIEEYRAVLAQDPTNLSAIDGMGSILYDMAGTPFDPEKMAEAKKYHQQHIDIKPRDPEPHYWIGVIDWSLAYRGNRDLRQNWMHKKSVTLATNETLPEPVRQEFENKFESIVDEGIEDMKQAIALRPDYDDAVAYLNLLYPMKAEIEPTAGLRDADLQTADELVDQVVKIKKKKLESSQPQ